MGALLRRDLGFGWSRPGRIGDRRRGVLLRLQRLPGGDPRLLRPLPQLGAQVDGYRPRPGRGTGYELVQSLRRGWEQRRRSAASGLDRGGRELVPGWNGCVSPVVPRRSGWRRLGGG